MRLIAPWMCALLLGCAGTPSEKGAQWFKASSEHFTVITDRGSSDATELAQKLERLLAAYLQLGWQIEGGITVKLTVIAFDDADDFNHFFGNDQLAGLFAPSLAFFEPTAVLTHADHLYDLEILKHELVHHIAYQAIARQPLWLAEGLASYFETARFEPDSGEFVVGEPQQTYAKSLPELGRIPVPELLGEGGPPTLRLYASAWLLVHYLMTEQNERFARYQQALSEGVSFEEAWRTGFPDMTPEQVDEQVARYAAKRELVAYARAVEPLEPEVAVEPLRRQDMHVLFALLYRACAGCDGDDAKRRAIAEADYALKLEPGNVSATVIKRYNLGAPPDIAFAKALAVSHPNDWLAWAWVISEELRSTRFPHVPGEIDAAAKVLELAPQRPYALALAALRRAALGEVDDAMQLSARAVRLAPADPPVRLARLLVLARVGDCRGAAEAAQALAQTPHRPWTNDQIRAFAECSAPQR